MTLALSAARVFEFEGSVVATSQQMRNMYPELVVGGVDSSWRVTDYAPTCEYGSNNKNLVSVKFLARGSDYPQGYVMLKVHKAVAGWARAIAAIMYAHNYAFEEIHGGSLSCRKITSGSKTSLHAHGVAIDFNPSRNRYRRQIGLIRWGVQTNMSREMIRDIEAVANRNGDVVTTWGGRWRNSKDPMHFEPSKVNREDLVIDQRTISGWPAYTAWAWKSLVVGNEEPMLRLGDKGNMIAKAQKGLNGFVTNFGKDSVLLIVDGDFGNKTRERVIEYQDSAYRQFADLVPGAISGVMMAALMEYVPDWIDAHTPPAPPMPEVNPGIQFGDEVAFQGIVTKGSTS